MNEASSQNLSENLSPGGGWKTKICIIIIMIIIFIGIWYFYVKSPINNSSPTIPEKFPDLPTNPDGAVLYIMSPDSGKLYMKDIKGLYWDAGLAADCQAIASSYSTVVIDDVYSIYNKKTLPDKYKGRKECQGITDNSYCSILIKTKEDYEKEIIKNLKGKYTPDVISCSMINNNNVSGNQPSNTDLGKLMLSVIKSAGMSCYDFLKSHREQLAELVKTVTPIVAVSIILSQFAELKMLTPLVMPFFIMMQSLSSGNVDAIKEASVQSAFIIFKTGVDKCREIARSGGLSLEKTEAEDLIGAVTEESSDLSIQVCNAIGDFLSSAGGRIFVEFLGFAGAAVEFLMITGMFLDMIDPCGLNKGFIDQKVMDNLKQAYDKSLFINTNGMAYPNVWNARFNCEYALDPNVYWKQCMTPEEQAKISQDDYCKDFNDKIKKYSKEYLNSLKVNSQGQCLKTGTNKDLENFLQQLIPETDWSSIGNLTQADVQNITLPMNDTLKKLDLLFSDNNVVVASYLNHYWYLVILFIIILIVIVIFV